MKHFTLNLCLLILPFIGNSQEFIHQPQSVKLFFWSNQSWLQSHQQGYRYDSNGRIVQRVFISKLGDSTSKDEYVFDKHGHQLFHGFYVRRNQTWELTVALRSTLSYDSVFTEKVTKQIDERFVNGNWVPDAIFYMHYNQDGELTRRVNEAPFMGGWVEATRILISYDAFGLQDTAVFQFNRNGEWVNDERIFGIKGRLLDKNGWTDYTMQRYVNDGWKNYSKRKTVKRERSLTKYTYTWKDGDWKIDYFKLDSFQQNGFLIYSDEIRLEDSVYKLVDRSRHQLEFEHGKLIAEEIQTWSIDQQQWLNAGRHEFEGSMVVTSNNNKLVLMDEAKVFPNPASNEVFIQNIEGEVHFEIFSISGLLMKKGICVSGSIGLSELNKGLYVLKLEKNGAIHQVKLVIQ